MTPGYEDLLAMTQEIERENVKLCLDVPLFQERQSDEYIREAVQKCSPYTVLSHFGAWNFSESSDGEVVQDPAPSFGGKTNYKRFLAELQQTDFSGYMVSECCLPVLKRHQIGGIEDVDYLTRISLEYMKNLVHQTAPIPALG